MSKHKNTLLTLLIGLISTFCLLPLQLSAGEGKLSGYMFGDYYYVVANHDSTIKDQNGFWFRRIYFTYDNELSESFTTRFRLELNSADFTKATAQITPYVKDAYLQWKVGGRHNILFGISATPTWEVLEGIWGYRSLEKTPLDLQKMGSSRDFGLAFQGAVDETKKLKYHLLVANGAGVNSENNKYKSLYGSLGFNPTSNILIEGYGDYKVTSDSTNVYTLQGFASYKNDRFKIGLHYATQSTNMEITDTTTGETTDTTITKPIVSAFTALNLTDKLAFLARVDKTLEPAASGQDYIPFAKDVKSTLIIAGLDYKPHKQVSIIPNVEVVMYDKPEGATEAPDTDIFGRLTFFYKW